MIPDDTRKAKHEDLVKFLIIPEFICHRDIFCNLSI